MYQAGKEPELTFDRLTVPCRDVSSGEITKNKVQGLLRPDAIVDFDLLILFTQFIQLLVPLAIGICLLAMLFRFAGNRGAGLKERLFWRGTFFGLLILLVIMAAKNLDIPAEFVPSKWSDFSFWTELWAEKKQALALMWQYEKTPADNLFYLAVWKTVLYGSLGFLCLLHGILLWRKESERFNGKHSIAEYRKDLWKRRRSCKRF